LFGIFHCFTGSVKQAHDVISLGGFKMGIGGVLTFKNGGLDQTVKEIDLKHLVLETDSPYLAPAPYRGKRNESSYLKIIAERLAEIKEKSLEEVAAITTENANMVFCQL
jgi:TatD DNase family protein